MQSNSSESKFHTTQKGTELPILILRGKDYLEVKYRVVWFREEHPDWSIETVITEKFADSATVKATILTETGRIVATSHKTEDKKGFLDFMEKAETGAIGRALALCGYGTQFCSDELDEGERIVDAPATPVKKAQVPAETHKAVVEGPKVKQEEATKVAAEDPSSPENFVIPGDGPYSGKKLRVIDNETLKVMLMKADDAISSSKNPSESLWALRNALNATIAKRIGTNNTQEQILKSDPPLPF